MRAADEESPPDQERSRPAGAAPTDSTAIKSGPIVPPNLDESPEDSLWEQMKLRREAALRLPPLADGRRDPLQLRPEDGPA